MGTRVHVSARVWAWARARSQVDRAQGGCGRGHSRPRVGSGVGLGAGKVPPSLPGKSCSRAVFLFCCFCSIASVTVFSFHSVCDIANCLLEGSRAFILSSFHSGTNEMKQNIIAEVKVLLTSAVKTQVIASFDAQGFQDKKLPDK